MLRVPLAQVVLNAGVGEKEGGFYAVWHGCAWTCDLMSLLIDATSSSNLATASDHRASTAGISPDGSVLTLALAANAEPNW